MASVFIDQSVVTGGTGTINVPIPGTATAGDLVIAFGMSQFDDAPSDANGYSFGPGAWIGSQGSDGILIGPRISWFCTRKYFAGETDLVLTPLNPTTTNHIQTVLQVWRGAALLFSGLTGEYNNSNDVIGYPATPTSSTEPNTADPTAIIGGVIAFSAMAVLDAATITTTGLEGFTNSALESNLRIDVRGFTQGEGGSSYPVPIYDFSLPTFCGGFSIGFSGAPEPVTDGEATWVIPPLTWSASGEVHAPTQGLRTLRMDAGEGSEWYLVPQLTDSGNELRSKTLTAMHATGRFTNASMMLYSYDVSIPINMDDLENGTNSATGPAALDNSTEVAQSARIQTNVPNADLWTCRIEGDDTGQAVRDRIDELVIESSDIGVRR